MFVVFSQRQMKIDYPFLLSLTIFIISNIQLSKIQSYIQGNKILLKNLAYEERFIEFSLGILVYLTTVYLVYRIMIYAYSVSPKLQFPSTNIKKD